MTVRTVTSAKTTAAQALIDAAGATGAKLKVYNGTAPAGVGAITGGNTLLASGQWASGKFGVPSGGNIDVDEAGFTQTPAGFVAGTSTFYDITTSADVVIHRLEVADWPFTGTVTPGQALTLTTLAINLPG